MKCEFCPRKIYETDEKVEFEDPVKGKLVKAHLSCFLNQKFLNISDKELISKADAIRVDIESVCPWCRQFVPVVLMSRSGQSICMHCLYKALSVLIKWYAKNIHILPQFPKK